MKTFPVPPSWRKIDWLLLAASLLLVGYGLIIIYSLDINSGTQLTFFYKQLIFFVIGMVIAAVISLVDFRHWKAYAPFLYAAGIVLLALVVALGQEIRGVKGWFTIGPLSLQPVEIVKVIVIIFFAKWFSEKGHWFYLKRYVVWSVLSIAPFVALLVLQPDWGSAFIVVTVWLAMLLFTRVRWRHIAVLALLFFLAAIIGWGSLESYQKNRLLTFVNPGSDPFGAGYNIRQAVTAIGSGQLTGRGLGLGPQSQLHFLPENRTDFIFSVIAEELGFVGSVVLIVLFVVVAYRLFRIARDSKNNFGFFLALGVLVFFSSQVLVNLGANVGLFPITGVPLPLVSQGGSSLWAVLVALGIAQSVKMKQSAL